jgi:hypothetical protein
VFDSNINIYIRELKHIELHNFMALSNNHSKAGEGKNVNG